MYVIWYILNWARSQSVTVYISKLHFPTAFLVLVIMASSPQLPDHDRWSVGIQYQYELIILHRSSTSTLSRSTITEWAIYWNRKGHCPDTKRTEESAIKWLSQYFIWRHHLENGIVSGSAIICFLFQGKPENARWSQFTENFEETQFAQIIRRSVQNTIRSGLSSNHGHCPEIKGCRTIRNLKQYVYGIVLCVVDSSGYHQVVRNKNQPEAHWPTSDQHKTGWHRAFCTERHVDRV